uniref:Tektin n=1 Tax=Cynoglossus semilaevis TaxID=244447 RepID=A0A3P8V6F2_CYNSE
TGDKMSALKEHIPHQEKAATHLRTMEVTVNQSEILRGKCVRLMMEIDRARRHIQETDKMRLDQRVRDVQFLEKELELTLEETIGETDNLITLKSRVLKALEACSDPMKRVSDVVGLELQREKGVIGGVSSVLKQVVEHITEQIRMNQSARHFLEKDLKEKYEAQRIDSTCIQLNTRSNRNLQHARNTGTILPSLAVTPKLWEEISDMNITKAEQQKTNSLSLRALVESLLGQTASDMRKQIQSTTAAFHQNVQDLKTAKCQMEDHLLKVQTAEVASQQTIRDDLLEAINENKHFLSLAQTRLDLRYQRPSKELCHDPAQIQLIDEVHQLTTHINRLREAVAQSKEKQRSLIRCELQLQESIGMKSTSLYIDEVICAQLREAIIIHNF